MSKLDWGLSSGHLYEHGVDRGVFYPPEGPGIPWKGLVKVNENHDGVNQTIRYYDGKKYRSQISAGEYAATIESYTYPILLDVYEEIASGLSANSRKGNTYFNFSYRTLTNDGYKIHLVYNATAKPSNKSYSTISDNAQPMVFSWDISTIPILIPGLKESSHIVIDSSLTYPWVVERVEDLLYVSEDGDARMPTVEELSVIFEEGSILRVTNLGNGLVQFDGPPNVIKSLGSNQYSITWPSVIPLGDHKYRISSL